MMLLLGFCSFIQTANIYTCNGYGNLLPSYLACLTIYVTDMHPLGDGNELLSEGYMKVSVLSVIFIAGEGFTAEAFLFQRRFTNRDAWVPPRKKNDSGPVKCWSPGVNSEIYGHTFYLFGWGPNLSNPLCIVLWTRKSVLKYLILYFIFVYLEKTAVNYHKIMLLRGRAQAPCMGGKGIFNVNNQGCEKAEIRAEDSEAEMTRFLWIQN